MCVGDNCGLVRNEAAEWWFVTIEAVLDLHSDLVELEGFMNKHAGRGIM